MRLPIVDMPGTRPVAPRVNRFTRTFWNSLAEGRLLTTRCRACEHTTFPPKQHCPACGERRTLWFELDGSGVIYSQTRVHAAPTQFAPAVPYCLAIIDLDEGPRLVTRLLGDTSGLRLGEKVQLVVTRYHDGCLFAATTNVQEL